MDLSFTNQKLPKLENFQVAIDCTQLASNNMPLFLPLHALYFKRSLHITKASFLLCFNFQ